MPVRGPYEPSTLTIDDREVECEVFKPRLRRGRYEGPRGVRVPRAEFDSVCAEVLPPSKPWYIAMLPIVGMAAVWCALVVPSMGPPWYVALAFGLFPLWGIAIMGGAIYGLVWLTSGVPTLTYAYPGPLSRAWLVRGRCASCGCPLDQIPPGKDGCTACPLCARAWRLKDAERAALPALRSFAEPAAVLLDASGERREAFRSGVFDRLLSRAARAEFPPAEFRAVHDEALRRTNFSRAKLLLVLGVFSLFVLAVVAGFALKNPGGLFVAIPAAAMLLGRAWGSLWRMPRGHAQNVRDAMLAHNRCPSCGVRLGPALDDGTRPCPTCEAVWSAGPPPPASPALSPSPL